MGRRVRARTRSPDRRACPTAGPWPVHGHVGPAVEHRLLHLFHEHAGAADRVRSARRAARRRWWTPRRARVRRRVRRRAARPTRSACHRASRLPRVAMRTDATMRSAADQLSRSGCVSRSNSVVSESASSSPRSVPAACFTRTVGSCNSLLAMPLRDRLDERNGVGVERGELGPDGARARAARTSFADGATR